MATDTKRHFLEREALQPLIQAERLEDVSVDDIFRFFAEEEQLHNYLPDGIYRRDPRDGSMIIYNSARARRPHDNVAERPSPLDKAASCPICNGKTTGVIDVAPLSEGVTFINKNLFPVLYVPDADMETPTPSANGETAADDDLAYGLHFLQWTSSYHDKDWENMPVEDLTVVVDRLALLEQKLLSQSGDLMPPAAAHRSADHDSDQAYGYVSIIKNYGNLVGGSLAHGHQQATFSNIMPRKFQNNLRFREEHGRFFTDHLLRDNPDHLLLKDYGPAVLLVPYFMRRPYDMMLVIKDTDKQYLHQLTPAERTAMAAGWQDAIRAIHQVMPAIGKELAYNVTVNNGPGAGLYVEFLPYTQQTGGLEHLGLWVCQDHPDNVAERVRVVLAEDEPETV